MIHAALRYNFRFSANMASISMADIYSRVSDIGDRKGEICPRGGCTCICLGKWEVVGLAENFMHP